MSRKQAQFLKALRVEEEKKKHGDATHLGAESLAEFGDRPLA